MADNVPFQVPPYSVLASVYDRAGYSDDARILVERVTQYAFATLNWAGRRVLDLGCGTGLTALWLAEQRYRVGAVDDSAAMLDQAHRNTAAAEDLRSAPPEFVQADLRTFESPFGAADLALALGGVVNALHSLRDVDMALGRVYTALAPGKPFIFDVRTVRGLADPDEGEQPAAFDDGEALAISVRSQFSYETLSSVHAYTIWQREGELWRRSDEVHRERGYPLQALAALLGRAGFTDVHMLSPTLEPLDPHAEAGGRALVVALRPAGE